MPKKSEPPKQSETSQNNKEGFSSLRNTLIKNMQTREKPSEEKKAPSEPVKVIKSEAMKNMVEAMNKHYEESSDTNEPVKIIEGTGGPSIPPPPPPPPPVVGGEPPKIGIPPPPPPPPPVPPFDPSKAPKKVKKPVVKKQPPPPPKTNNTSNAPTMKEQLMKVSLKKVGK